MARESLAPGLEAPSVFLLDQSGQPDWEMPDLGVEWTGNHTSLDWWNGTQRSDRAKPRKPTPGRK